MNLDDTETVKTAPHYYWGCCMVCGATSNRSDDPFKTTTLKRCSRCRCVTYCCVEHQKLHWKYHKALCNYLSAAAGEVGADTFFAAGTGPEADALPITDEGNADEDVAANGASAWRSWRQFRVRAIFTCEAIMRRSLELYEREVFFFPQACRVCFQAKADGMIPCEKCWNVAYCSEQHRDEHIDKHNRSQCLELLHCMAADVYESSVSIANPPIPTDVDCEYMKTNHLDMTKYLAILLGQKNYRNLTDIQMLDLKFLSDRLSGPLTLYYVMEKFGLSGGCSLSDRKELVIHIVGAALPEMVGIKKWEFLHHRLPECQKLKFVFIGPDVIEAEDGELERLQNCSVCKDKGKETQYEFFNCEYSTYASQRVTYFQPDLVAVFNCGFSEHRENPEKDTWKDSFEALVQQSGAPLLFTSYNIGEARRDFNRIHMESGMDLKVDVQREENPFRSLRPIRDWELENDQDVFYNNQFFSVVRAL